MRIPCLTYTRQTGSHQHAPMVYFTGDSEPLTYTLSQEKGSVRSCRSPLIQTQRQLCLSSASKEAGRKEKELVVCAHVYLMWQEKANKACVHAFYTSAHIAMLKPLLLCCSVSCKSCAVISDIRFTFVCVVQFGNI